MNYSLTGVKCRATSVAKNVKVVGRWWLWCCIALINNSFIPVCRESIDGVMINCVHDGDEEPIVRISGIELQLTLIVELALSTKKWGRHKRMMGGWSKGWPVLQWVGADAGVSWDLDSRHLITKQCGGSIMIHSPPSENVHWWKIRWLVTSTWFSWPGWIWTARFRRKGNSPGFPM